MKQEEVKILLVEDSPADVELTLHALRSANLSDCVRVARDGEEALDFLFCRGPYGDHSFQSPPRLVLLDLKLPKADGMQVLRELKSDQRTKAIPVVVLTSSREEADLVRSHQLGANSYIHKPVEFDRFREMVKQQGFYWLVVNQPPPPAPFRPT